MANYTEANQNKLIKKRQIRKLNTVGLIGKINEYSKGHTH